MKTCKMCLQALPLDRFSPARTGKDGVKTACRECLNAEARRIRREDPAEAQRRRDRWNAWRKAKVEKEPEWREREWKKEQGRRHQQRAADPVAFAIHQRKIMRASRLRTGYGLTIAEYDELLAAQGGVCAICALPERVQRNGVTMNMPVDHDHETGAVRGIVCSNCNNGLGRFADDPSRLRAAANYIEQARAMEEETA